MATATEPIAQHWPTGTWHPGPYTEWPLCRCIPCREQGEQVFPRSFAFEPMQFNAAIEWGARLAAHEKQSGGDPDTARVKREAIGIYAVSRLLAVEPPLQTLDPEPLVRGLKVVTLAHRDGPLEVRDGQVWSNRIFVVVRPVVDGRFGRVEVVGWCYGSDLLDSGVDGSDGTIRLGQDVLRRTSIPREPDDIVAEAYERVFDVEASEEARDEAIRRGDVAADPQWKERAYQALLACARANPTFIVDQVWEYLAREDVPKEPRAMGAILIRGAKEGVIARTREYRLSDRVSAHRNPRVVWQSSVAGQD